MNLKSQILALTTMLACVAVNAKSVPEGVFVRKFNIGERENYAKIIEKSVKKDKVSVNALAFCLVVCDENGQTVFDEKDVDKVSELPADLVLSVLEVFNRENGFIKDDKAVDKAEKN